MSIFKSEIHLPSGVKEWQHPGAAAFPNPSAFLRWLPDDEQDTSYLAPFVKIFSFSSLIIPPLYTRLFYLSNIRS